jgi:hypothetical protein
MCLLETDASPTLEIQAAVFSGRSQISTSAYELRPRKRQGNVGFGEEEMLEDLKEVGEM